MSLEQKQPRLATLAVAIDIDYRAHDGTVVLPPQTDTGADSVSHPRSYAPSQPTRVAAPRPLRGPSHHHLLHIGSGARRGRDGSSRQAHRGERRHHRFPGCGGVPGALAAARPGPEPERQRERLRLPARTSLWTTTAAGWFWPKPATTPGAAVLPSRRSKWNQRPNPRTPRTRCRSASPPGSWILPPCDARLITVCYRISCSEGR